MPSSRLCHCGPTTALRAVPLPTFDGEDFVGQSIRFSPFAKRCALAM